MSRITEKRILKIDPIALSSDGTNVGRITVPDSSKFMVGQIIRLVSSVTGPAFFKINRIHPVDHINMWVGPVKEHISKRADVSGYLVADGATIDANEQERPSVPEQEIERHTYEEEPTVARRVILVDKWGCRIDSDNPLPTTATLDVDNLTIPVDIDAKDGDNIAAGARPLAQQIYDEAANTVSTTAFKEIYSYSSTNDDFRVEVVEVTVRTPSLVVVKIDGAIVKERQTSPFDRDAIFNFVEPRQVLSGKTLTVEVCPDRILVGPYNTFTSLEGFLCNP